MTLQTNQDLDIARLRRHITYGGFLLIDSAEGRAGGGFERGIRLLAAGRLLGRQGKGGGEQERQSEDRQGSSHVNLQERLRRDLLSQGSAAL